jgi:hypothetical protein
MMAYDFGVITAPRTSTLPRRALRDAAAGAAMMVRLSRRFISKLFLDARFLRVPPTRRGI